MGRIHETKGEVLVLDMKFRTRRPKLDGHSPSLGYFAIEKSLDYWHVTGSSSLRIVRNTIQVICAHESDNVMFLETCEAEGKIQNFRCPQSDCKKTMRIPAGGSPVCWLVEGFFESEQPTVQYSVRL